MFRKINKLNSDSVYYHKCIFDIYQLRIENNEFQEILRIIRFDTNGLI